MDVARLGMARRCVAGLGSARLGVAVPGQAGRG